MSWWSKATEAQKLAQIDGGIECGMTSRQIAIASGLDGEAMNTVMGFAHHHGRKFGRAGKSHFPGDSTQRTFSVRRDRDAFLSGDRVNLWGNPEPEDEFALDPIPAHTEEDA